MEYECFKNKSPNFKLLQDFGFKKQNENYIFERKILKGEFILRIEISHGEKISVKIYDETGEEYTLHKIEGAGGEFVGRVRRERDDILSEISQKCFYENVFKERLSKEIISYAFEKYGDSLEFLWKKLPCAAVLRRKDTQKWYGVFMKVSAEKLGIDSDKEIEILNLHTNPKNMESVLDGNAYFPGWHMNKKSWFSVNLSANVPKEEVFEKMIESYNLAVKKR